MSEVALHIGGRTYRVACAAGEEERVTRLGGTIADKLASMGNPSGPDAQNLLFAALLLADEVHEGREGVAAAEDRVAAAQREARDAADEHDRSAARIAALESEAARLQASLHDANSALAEREAEAAALKGQIAELRADPAPAGVGAAAELAPALERFAEMLEECADKLERRAAAP